MINRTFIFTVYFLLSAFLFCFGGDGSVKAESDSTGNVRWFTGNIIDRVVMRSYFLDTRYPTEWYTLVNSDGDVLNRGLTIFSGFTGHGNILGTLSYDYRFQNKNAGGLRLKEGSVKLSRWGMSLEYGRRNSWIGHGYYGSMLLSNNAEPYEVVKFQTERPVRIPYIGHIEYKLLHGWVNENFDLFAHRVSYRPFSWLEIGGNQLVRYYKNFKWYEFFRVITGKYANFPTPEQPDIAQNTDIIASMDVSVRFSFPGNLLYPVQRGGMFFEYAGEDLVAYWQDEDAPWIGPFGFDFLSSGTVTGIWFETEKEEVRIEYAQNFRDSYLLSSYAGGVIRSRYASVWYGQRGRHPHYLNSGNLLGHHMGASADSWYVHFKRTDEREMFRMYYSTRRRGIVVFTQADNYLSDSPEVFRIIGLEYRRNFSNFTLGTILEWHHFENMDFDPNPLRHDILPGSNANQFLFGVELSYLLSDNAIATGPADFSWLDIDPITRLRFRGYYLHTERPSDRYNLVNAYGDKLESALSPFWNIEGRVSAFDAVTLDYNFQADLSNRLKLKHAVLRYTAGPAAFTVERGSVWLGHGYYGALLLSNNAEPFSLVRFELTEPLHVPYIGSVQYTLFNGWPENFNIVGHRLTWFPHRWVEIGGNKIVTYTEGRQLWSVPFMLFEDPSVDRHGHRRDARVSIDVALHLPFLRDYLYPLVDGKIYYEYAGEELYSFWTTKDAGWVGPLGFEFVGVGNLMGVWLATDRYDFRLEYAQNYRNNYLFNSVAGNHLWDRYSIPWYGAYGRLPYLNYGNIMGHHMGSHADVIYTQFRYFLEESTVKIFYNNRRRGLVERQPPLEQSAHPEEMTQYGIEVSRNLWNFTITGLFKWNHYKNIDQNSNPLIVNPSPDTEANEFILGFTVEYRLGK